MSYNQTDGKGQRDTNWESNAGENLLISVVLDMKNIPVSNIFYLSKSMALAVRACVSQVTALECMVKWPNDIMVRNQKVAGILIENSLQGQRSNLSIVGIGINVNQTDFSHLPKASSLSLALGRPLDREQLFTDLLTALENAFMTLDSRDASVLNKTYEKQLFGREVWHSFIYNGEHRRGKIRGVTTKGALQIEWGSNELQYFKDSKALTLLY